MLLFVDWKRFSKFQGKWTQLRSYKNWWIYEENQLILSNLNSKLYVVSLRNLSWSRQFCVYIWSTIRAVLKMLTYTNIYIDHNFLVCLILLYRSKRKQESEKERRTNYFIFGIKQLKLTQKHYYECIFLKLKIDVKQDHF